MIPEPQEEWINRQNVHRKPRKNGKITIELLSILAAASMLILSVIYVVFNMQTKTPSAIAQNLILSDICHDGMVYVTDNRNMLTVKISEFGGPVYCGDKAWLTLEAE